MGGLVGLASRAAQIALDQVPRCQAAPRYWARRMLERGAAQTQRRSVFSAENGEERDAVADFRALRGSCEYQVTPLLSRSFFLVPEVGMAGIS